MHFPLMQALVAAKRCRARDESHTSLGLVSREGLSGIGTFILDNTGRKKTLAKLSGGSDSEEMWRVHFSISIR